jgi:hypothetical protein
MLTTSLGLEHSFVQAEINNLRYHIALQRLRQTIFLPEYDIHANTKPQSYPRSTTPHSESEVDAATSLLDLSATPTRPHVRFNPLVDIREFNSMFSLVFEVLVHDLMPIVT